MSLTGLFCSSLSFCRLSLSSSGSLIVIVSIVRHRNTAREKSRNYRAPRPPHAPFAKGSSWSYFCFSVNASVATRETYKIMGCPLLCFFPLTRESLFAYKTPENPDTYLLREISARHYRDTWTPKSQEKVIPSCLDCSLSCGAHIPIHHRHQDI